MWIYLIKKILFYKMAQITEGLSVSIELPHIITNIDQISLLVLKKLLEKKKILEKKFLKISDYPVIEITFKKDNILYSYEIEKSSTIIKFLEKQQYHMISMDDLVGLFDTNNPKSITNIRGNLRKKCNIIGCHQLSQIMGKYKVFYIQGNGDDTNNVLKSLDCLYNNISCTNHYYYYY